MRKAILAVLVLAACAKGDDAATDTTAGDTAVAATPAMTPVQAMYAGTWNGRSYRAGVATDTGTPWTMIFTASGDSALTGTLRFPGQTTDIPIRVEEATEAGIRTSFGPYTSPTVGNAEVSTTTDGRVAGDSLFGSFVATPSAGGNRTSGRFAARRAP